MHEPSAMQSWKPEVIADSSGKWCGNALRFATKQEAEANANDLAFRWTAVRECRAAQSEDPVKHTYHNHELKEVAQDAA